jgi:GntP family gluconate:H+ symporter
VDPLIVLLIAVAVVVGGVLVLRLHPVLALLAGAFAVAWLTPAESVFQHEVRVAGLVVESIQVDTNSVQLRTGRGRRIVPGRQAVFRPLPNTSRYEAIGYAMLALEGPADAAHVRLTAEDKKLEIRPGDLVLHHTLTSQARATAAETIGQRVARGFGGTCTKIGILIALAAIIGTCLLDSGAAERIVNTIRGLLGDRQAPVAFSVSGFLVGIPVFFDTVFYLLIPLGKAMRARTGKDYLLYVLSIVVGATMAHSLVPPTPGPLFVASELGVSIGLMMLGGIAVGAVAAASGYAYALWANRRWQIPLRNVDDSGDEKATADTGAADRVPPPFWLAVLPIVLPIVLLGTRTCIDMNWASVAAEDQPAWVVTLQPVVRTLGDKNVALALAAVAAILMLVKACGWRAMASGTAVQTALMSGGLIILITASGGALGHVLRQTGIAAAIQERLPATETGIALLLLAFTVTAVVRVAQGSATVAMITAVGIVAPIVATAPLPYHPLYVALAIGCGSKPLPWMNDSGFWVVGRMSGMTTSETLKTFSAALTIMGVVGMLVTLAGALLLPMV